MTDHSDPMRTSGRKAGRPMTDHSDPTRTIGGSSVNQTTTEEILAIIAAEEPRGATPDQVARAIGLGFDETLMRDALEELVDRGLLNQFGIGHKAVYTLNPMA